MNPMRSWRVASSSKMLLPLGRLSCALSYMIETNILSMPFSRSAALLSFEVIPVGQRNRPCRCVTNKHHTLLHSCPHEIAFCIQSCSTLKTWLSDSGANPFSNACSLAIRLIACVMPLVLENFAMNPPLPPVRTQSLTWSVPNFWLARCFSSLLCPWEKLTGEHPWLGIYLCNVWCVVWPYLGSVAFEYKTSPRESDSVDVNHSETDDVTFIIYPLLTTFYPCNDVLTTLCCNFHDWNMWQNLILLQL